MIDMNRISNKANTQKLNTKNKNFQSTGNLFLDKIINGISLGTIVLLVQDNPTDIYQTFVKYFVGEGIVHLRRISLVLASMGNVVRVA